MPDILIRGMEMPNCCFDCPVFDDFCQERCGVTGTLMYGEIDPKMETLPDCPIVPLPEGHGRLIDADALLLDAGEVCEVCGDGFAIFGFSREQIENSPTIVPAEGGTDDV